MLELALVLLTGVSIFFNWRQHRELNRVYERQANRENVQRAQDRAFAAPRLKATYRGSSQQTSPSRIQGLAKLELDCLSGKAFKIGAKLFVPNSRCEWRCSIPSTLAMNEYAELAIAYDVERPERDGPLYFVFVTACVDIRGEGSMQFHNVVLNDGTHASIDSSESRPIGYEGVRDLATGWLVGSASTPPKVRANPEL